MFLTEAPNTPPRSSTKVGGSVANSPRSAAGSVGSARISKAKSSQKRNQTAVKEAAPLPLVSAMRLPPPPVDASVPYSAADAGLTRQERREQTIPAGIKLKPLERWAKTPQADLGNCRSPVTQAAFEASAMEHVRSPDCMCKQLWAARLLC